MQNTRTREISNARKTSHNHSNRDTSRLRCLSPDMEVNTRWKLVPCMYLVFTGMEVNTRCMLVSCMYLVFTRMLGLLRSVPVFVWRLSSADWQGCLGLLFLSNKQRRKKRHYFQLTEEPVTRRRGPRQRQWSWGQKAGHAPHNGSAVSKILSLFLISLDGIYLANR